MVYRLYDRSTYFGSYVQDAWRAASRLTINAGLRWEPYLPYTEELGQFSHFDLEQWRSGVRSTVYRNAPLGVIFTGDPGYPGKAAGTKQLANFAPRVSSAWDVRGDGRMTVRTAWGRFYDLPHLYMFLGFAVAPPLGSVITVNGASYDRGSCGAADRRHVVNLSTVYQLPEFSQGAVGMLTNDWQVSAIVRAQTGNHFEVTTGIDNALSGQGNQRPNQVKDNPYLKSGYRWLGPTAFQAPAPGTYGNTPIHAFVGPGTFNVDMGITRSFRVAGERQIQLRAEIFNLLNTTQLNNPVSSLNNSNFGLITSANDPRIVQLALKYVF